MTNTEVTIRSEIIRVDALITKTVRSPEINATYRDLRAALFVMLNNELMLQALAGNGRRTA